MAWLGAAFGGGAAAGAGGAASAGAAGAAGGAAASGAAAGGAGAAGAGAAGAGGAAAGGAGAAGAGAAAGGGGFASMIGEALSGQLNAGSVIRGIGDKMPKGAMADFTKSVGNSFDPFTGGMRLDALFDKDTGSRLAEQRDMLEQLTEDDSGVLDGLVSAIMGMKKDGKK